MLPGQSRPDSLRGSRGVTVQIEGRVPDDLPLLQPHGRDAIALAEQEPTFGVQAVEDDRSVFQNETQSIELVVKTLPGPITHHNAPFLLARFATRAKHRPSQQELTLHSPNFLLLNSLLYSQHAEDRCGGRSIPPWIDAYRPRRRHNRSARPRLRAK